MSSYTYYIYIYIYILKKIYIYIYILKKINIYITTPCGVIPTENLIAGIYIHTVGIVLV